MDAYRWAVVAADMMQPPVSVGITGDREKAQAAAGSALLGSRRGIVAVVRGGPPGAVVARHRRGIPADRRSVDGTAQARRRRPLGRADDAAVTTVPRHVQAADLVKGWIADGALKPGCPAPSGSELARAGGFSPSTCRRALRMLIADGVLVPGPSRAARPRVADPQASGVERDIAEATRALSAGLSARRRAAGLTQAELAALTHVSVTTVGHAETGRTWQSRRFWERADDALRADGGLLLLYDAYRAAAPTGTAPPAPGPDAAAPALVVVMLVWDDGTVTTMNPAERKYRPPGSPRTAGRRA